MSSDDDFARLLAGFAAMIGPDDEPIAGTPLSLATDPAVNPLAAVKILSDYVQQYIECDLETANELLARWNEQLELAADVVLLQDDPGAAM